MSVTDPPPAPSAKPVQGLAPPPRRVRSMPPPVPGTGLSQRYQLPAVQSAPTYVGTAPTAGAKSLVIAYLLWLFLGWLGAHQFYLGKKGRGVGYLLTCAWLTLAWWIDLFTLPAQVRSIHAQHEKGA